MKKDIKKEIRRYHFIGIGGMGMGNLALLMLAKGYQVSGSDKKESELTRQLRERGATIFIDHHIKNVEQAECVVYSSAISASNPEFFEAVRRHIPILKRAELLAELVNQEVGITVGGAHGKTTTSSMASLLLINAELKPTTAIGGIVGQGYNANLGIGRHFVAEVDESDGSFLYFKPHFSIITNMDFEHVDYYHTWDNIKEAYAKFVECTVQCGVIISCGDDVNLRQIVEAGGRRFTTYGFGDNNEWIARDIQCDAGGSSYECFYKGESQGRFELTVPGKHNVLNSLSIVALGFELKISPDVIRETLKKFEGVKRRFQKKGDVGGVLVVDDYGHHPTEIAATLQTAKALDRKRLITVFQPHRYSRTKFLMDEFSACFNLADYLILTDIYAASEKPIDGVTIEVFVHKIRAQRQKNLTYLKKEEIVDHLMKMVHPGDLVLTLGAGDITQVSDDLVQRLEERQVLAGLPYVRNRSKEEIRRLGQIGVIMGGCSSERDVSINSGTAILKALTEAGCQVKPLDLTTEDRETVKTCIKAEKIDVAFIALHGRFGEDGVLQGILEELHIPYNGCGISASLLAFNKCLSQERFEIKGIRTPKTVVVKANVPFDLSSLTGGLGGYPLVVKPACEGSSIGVNLAKDEGELLSGIQKAWEYGPDVLVQECIRGRELTVGILGVTPLPIVEICGQHPFFDFQAKYKDQTTQYFVPAKLSADVARSVQLEAVKAYEALGCEGFGRVDVLLDEKNVPFVLEINTIPGFTAKSLLPKAARAAGLDFQQLCLTLVEMAYGKKKTDSSIRQH
ncbi:MAG: UDP-N-acetylmuramate--L-alanine ligase [Candidatus Omnitrophica bacterium]|nr:UDP-N-acetylmuramate--L-alanine ligase [Candidatus Omnitrophota bacterium]